MLRLLAWGAGHYPTKWRLRETEDVVVLRIPVDTFRREIGADLKVAPSNLMRHHIEPALTEFRSFSDIECDIQLVHAPSIRPGGRRVVSIEVLTDRVKPRIAKRTAVPSATVLPFGRSDIDIPEPALDFD